jgi:hypothetical protein
MSEDLKYMPILRVRQQELIVLKSFDFKQRIYPCLEIIKELDRLPPKPRKNSKTPAKPKKKKEFEEVYLPLIQKIKAEKIFVDLPVHLNEYRNTKPETLDFLRSVIARQAVRTEYMIKLAPLANKVIPVISTYYTRTGEQGSISSQVKDLRPHFKALAFRTFQDSFNRDILQIEEAAKQGDYIIMDWANNELDKNDGDQEDIVTKLKTLNCTIIIHRNPIAAEITNVGLEHGMVVEEIDNSLLDKYQDSAGSCFSDYSGIKKDNISKGGTISPGFIYYDAVKNEFYGYKGARKELDEFVITIVPAVLSSDASRRMNAHVPCYLGPDNIGWGLLQNIGRNIEPGKSPAKFKRIAMEHYLNCIRTKIANGDFD